MGNQIPIQARVESQSTRMMLTPTQPGSRDLSPSPATASAAPEPPKQQVIEGSNDQQASTEGGETQDPEESQQQQQSPQVPTAFRDRSLHSACARVAALRPFPAST